MKFEFATATRIVFGAGSVKELPAAIASMGSKALAVTGGSGRFAPAGSVVYRVAGEPTIQTIVDGVACARQAGCDVVVAIGGGSAIDAGKAIAALLTNAGEVLDYIEVVGRGKTIGVAPAPFIAVPTTAGTGSEVTRNAVVAAEEHKVKASLRSPLMLPRLAIIDPALTLDLPRAVTAATGLDALTQCIEPYVSSKANAFTDMYCLEGIRRAARSLPVVCDEPSDLDARTDMAMTSLLGGLSLANAGLGVVHGFAAPIGGAFAAPHGAVCAALLPGGIAANVRALRERAAGADALRRYETIARMVTGRDGAKAEDAADWAAQMVTRLGVPGLGAYGITEADVDSIVEKAQAASSMKANPIVLTRGELEAVLKGAL